MARTVPHERATCDDINAPLFVRLPEYCPRVASVASGNTPTQPFSHRTLLTTRVPRSGAMSSA